MTFLAENIGTILISFLLIAAVLLIVRKLFHDKKNGRSSCGGSCGHCAMGCACRGAARAGIESCSHERSVHHERSDRWEK